MQDLTAEILPKFSGVFDRSPFMWGIVGKWYSKYEVLLTLDDYTQTPPPETTVVIPTGAPASNTVANHAERPEKFNETALIRVEPPAEGQSSNAQAVQAVEAWKHSDFLCHNYVLNGLIDPLYNVYCKTTTAKELWESLERKYKTEDAGTKKFVVARFLDYKMVDSKNVIILKKTQAGSEGTLIHMISAKVIWVEHAGSSSRFNSKGNKKDKKKNDKKGKGKSGVLVLKLDCEQSFQGTCYNCDQQGHRAANLKDAEAGVNLERLTMNISCILGHNYFATIDFKGEGDVILKMTILRKGKRAKLTNVLLFGDSARKNLVIPVGCFKHKDEAIDKFVLYKTEVENQLGKKIKVVRSDRGGEYVAPFAELYAKHGIRHEFTAPYSPQQNGIAERKNRTLKEMVTAMLISSGMSQDMWGEAILTATYLLNKIPRKEKEETPYELWMGRKPSYQYLRVWGCLAKVAVPTPKAQKIGPKSVDCIFIGYA
ncbi:retrovirus-related pol polyprotein from transposon TNT 1-94 [Tanacetum coccineum]